jgi:hypothetical protein
MKGRWIVFPAGILIAITGFAWTGQEPDRPMPPRPPKEALAACESKAEGGACTVETSNGDRKWARALAVQRQYQAHKCQRRVCSAAT